MRRAALAALPLAAVAGIPAAAQDATAPISTLTTTISQSAVADSNYRLDDPSPGTSYYGDTRVGLDYLKSTPEQTFGLGINTGLRALWEADENFDVVVASPSRAYLKFNQEGPNTAFDANLRARSRRVDFNSPSDFDPGVAGEGTDNLNGLQGNTREYRYDANVGFLLGTNSPSSYEFRVIATAFDYADLGQTNQVPRQSVEGQASWTLRVTPVLSTIVFGSYFHYQSESNTDDEIQIGEGEAGLVYQPGETLRIRGGIGYAQRTRDETRKGVRQTTEDNAGPTFRGDVRYILPDFTVFGNIRVSTAAPSTRVDGTLRANYTLRRGAINGRIFQQYTGGRNGDEERVTGAGIGIVRDINNLSRVGLDFGYATQEDSRQPQPLEHRPDGHHGELYLRRHPIDQRRDRLRLPKQGRGPQGRRQPPGLRHPRKDLRDRALRARLPEGDPLGTGPRRPGPPFPSRGPIRGPSDQAASSLDAKLSSMSG